MGGVVLNVDTPASLTGRALGFGGGVTGAVAPLVPVPPTLLGAFPRVRVPPGRLPSAA